MLSSPQPASADTLSSAQAEASQLTAEIQAEGQRLDILSQQYDAAQQQVQALAAQESVIEGQITLTKQKVTQARGSLRRQALSVYMHGSDVGLESFFAGPSAQAPLTDEYRSVAAGNLSGAIDTLQAAQVTLAAQQSQLQTTESQAQAAATQLEGARSAAQAEQQTEQQTLTQVKGQIAVLVAQQQAAEAAAQAAAFQARQAQEAAAARAAAAASSASGGGSHLPGQGATATFTAVPVAPGAAGAVQAAKSQLGVPYVWGGETPGVGFDCSGLTQWSWGQAGVSIPRTAQDQYDAIAHVSLSDLEPGDLLFWNDGTSSIQHVAMYVGGDEVIQAPETGETVSYAPIWNNGLVGAGRP
ncbi:MAG TPA: C40 family peptidase [Acidimicrobiales bacterium]|nr:C40 family peptidase [Acidimicrobiales bacterium]